MLQDARQQRTDKIYQALFAVQWKQKSVAVRIFWFTLFWREDSISRFVLLFRRESVALALG
jgi:hypothetical protein